MTGTPQFAAMEILRGIDKNKPVAHELRHDLESFGWVLGYAVARYHAAENRLPNVFSEKDWRTMVLPKFCRTFEQRNIEEIFHFRSGGPNPLAMGYPAELLSAPLAAAGLLFAVASWLLILSHQEQRTAGAQSWRVQQTPGGRRRAASRHKAVFRFIPVDCALTVLTPGIASENGVGVLYSGCGCAAVSWLRSSTSKVERIWILAGLATRVLKEESGCMKGAVVQGFLRGNAVVAEHFALV
ncbi:hypothetical protein HWV62_5728 [Athelia sp. TMB]|nr:hypothetical protein HWV62_5728 [Athelia sp. TMB]